MRNPFIWLPAIVLLWASCKEAAKPVKEPTLYSAAALRENISVGAAGFNKDETAVMIEDNSTGIFNVYALSLADSSKKTLTHSVKESFYAVDYLPGKEDLTREFPMTGCGRHHHRSFSLTVCCVTLCISTG